MNGTLYYKSKLDLYDQKIYDELIKKWTRFETIIEIAEPHCGVETLISAIHNDNPLLFFVDFSKQLLTYYKMGPLVWWTASYLFEKGQAKQLLDRCEKWGKYIISRKPVNIGQVELALWLHDVVINNFVYSDENASRAHSMIGVISDGKAVCDGASRTYKFLCDLAGIPCIIVIGTSGGIPHAWNMIWIGNEPAFVDVTNDRDVNGQAGREHFIRNTNEMSGYTWDKNVIPISRIKNKSNAYLIVHSKEELIKLTKQNINNSSLSISLEFGQTLGAGEIEKMAEELFKAGSFNQTTKLSYTIDPPMIFLS